MPLAVYYDYLHSLFCAKSEQLGLSSLFSVFVFIVVVLLFFFSLMHAVDRRFFPCSRVLELSKYYSYNFYYYYYYYYYFYVQCVYYTYFQSQYTTPTSLACVRTIDARTFLLLLDSFLVLPFPLPSAIGPREPYSTSFLK